MWSQSLEFTTVIDDIAPLVPDNVTWSSIGTSFLATWDAVSLLAEENFDFSHYLVTVSYSGSPVNFTVGASDAPRFDLTLEANRAAFGTPRSPLTFTVRSVDKTGNVSAASAPILATNPVPDAVTVSTSSAVEQIGLRWTAEDDDDLEGYNVYASQTNLFTPGPSNKVSFTKSLSHTHYTTSTAPWYFHVKSVDVFGQESTSTQVVATANAPAGADTTPPDVPSAVTTVAGFDNDRQQAYIDVDWTASPSPDLRSYTVRYSLGAPGDWEYVTVEAPDTATRIFVRSGSSYFVGVNAKDFFGNISAYVDSSSYPVATPLDTTAPSQPAAPTAVGNTLQVQVTHDNLKQAGGTIEADTEYYDVYASKTSGFTPSIVNYLGKLIKSNVTSDTFPLPTTITGGVTDPWYVKVNAVDATGNVSTTSPQTTVTPGLITNANIADATITSAKITNLDAGKLTAGSAIIADLIIGDATHTGSIKSYDYDALTESGWFVGYNHVTGENMLEINEGLVRARALELKNSFNLMPPILADFEARRSIYEDSILPSGVDITINSDPYPTGGTQALQLTVADTDWYVDIGNGPIVEVEEDKEYIFSFYAKASAAVSINAIMMHEVVIPATGEDPETVTLQGIGSPTGVSLTTSYTRHYFTFTGPNGPVLPRLLAFGATLGTVITIDALQIEERVGVLETPSRWQPPSSTTIVGGQVVTGSLQSSDESTGRPAWLIDMTGGAEFASAKILGSLVVGTADENDASYIQSGNYDTATQGWKIDASGKAEFNDTTIRGEGTLTNAIITTDLTISAEAGDTPATMGLTNGSIQTIYGTLTSPPAPTVSHYDNSYYTINSQRDLLTNLANMDYAGPVYIGTDTYFAVAEVSGDTVYLYIDKCDSLGNNPVSYKTTGTTFSKSGYGITDIKKFLAGISYDGTFFNVGIRIDDLNFAYRNIKFTASTGAFSAWDSFDLPVNTDRLNGYHTNWQKSGGAWYAAYCLNTDIEENRVLNPNFASSISNWTYYAGSNTTVLEHDAANGRLRVRNWGTGANNYAKGATPFLHVPTAEVGDNIYVTAYVRESSIQSNVRINIKWANGTSNTSTIQSTPISGRVSFNAVAPVAGTYTVGIYFSPVSGNWGEGVIAGVIDNCQVSNNKKNLRKVAMGFSDGTSTGWAWTGTANASESHRVFLAGQLLVDKYNATTGALEQRNLGHQLYSDITGFVVGAGDYTYANVTNPNSFTITRRSDPTQPENNFGLSFISYVDPGSGVGTALTFREGAYTFKDGLGYNSSVGDYRAYDRATYKLEILPHIHGDGIGPLMASVTYWHDNVAHGGIQRRTLPGPISKLDTVFSRKRLALSNLVEPSVPVTVDATDAPTGFWFYWGTQGTTDYTKFYGTGVLSFASYSGGKVVFSDMRLVPRATPTTLVPANNGTSSGPPATVNGFANVAGFVSSKIKSANDIFTVDGNGVGRIGGLAFSELGLELGNLFGGTSGELKSATGSFLLKHDGTGTWPGLREATVYTGTGTAISPFTATMTFKRIGRLVIATGFIQRASSFSTTITDACIIPLGFRPDTASFILPSSLFTLSTTIVYRVQIGTVNIGVAQSAANTNGMFVNATWTTSDAYP